MWRFGAQLGAKRVQKPKVDAFGNREGYQAQMGTESNILQWHLDCGTYFSPLVWRSRQLQLE
jgi:hypothetical protein